jgi:CheY-like chemotaxis protein
MVRNILFVDDDKILCNAVAKRLAKYSESFAVVTACDGFDAVQQLKKTPVSLVILELKMSRMDGMSLVNHLREHYPDLPCVVISSMDDARLQEVSKADGIIGYLKKPIQADKLVSIIKNTLQKEAAAGIMHDISPAMFLQLMEMDAKSCTIRIIDNATQQGGILFFKDGEMLDARIGILHGIEAAYELFSWDTATIFMRNECDQKENNINSALTPIIMKAVGMKDEAQEPEQGSSSDTSIPAASNEKSVFDISRIEMLKKNLGKELGLKKCFQDTQVTKAVEQLTKTSNNAFGTFKFAYVTSSKNNRVVLSGQPPTVLELDKNCAADKIIQLLSDNALKEDNRVQ